MSDAEFEEKTPSTNQTANGDGNVQVSGSGNTVSVNQIIVRLEFLQKFWPPIVALLGAGALIYGYYQLWSGDQSILTWSLTGGGLLVLIVSLAFAGFSQKTATQKAGWTNPLFEDQHRKIARFAFGLVSLLVIAGTIALFFQRQAQAKVRAELEEKLIVVIATFDGPEEVYGLRNEIIEKLNKDFASDENIIILPIDDVITTALGSPHARQLGEERLADVVIWGWYRPTENPNITIHVENLSPSQLISLKSKETFQPQTTQADLESFTFQQKAGEETSALISFLAGLLEYLSGNYQTALSHFDQVMKNSQLFQEPIFLNLAGVYFFRGNSQYLLRNLPTSIQEFSKSIEIYPEFQDAYINRGSVYLEMKQYSSALEDFNKAIEIDSTSALAYTNRANIYYLQNQLQDAFADVNRAIEIDPNFLLAYENRGAFFTNLGEYKSAISDFEKALEISPSNFRVYNNLGLVYTNLNDKEKAISAFEMAIFLNPKFARTYYNLGNLHKQNQEYKIAIEKLNQAVALQPDYAFAHLSIGDCYLLQSDYQPAIQSYTRAIQIEPKNAKFINNRGVAYAMMGEFYLAIQDFSQAITIEPHAMPYMNIGKSYAALGELDEALENLNYAIYLDPVYADAYYNRGLAYQQLGETAKAEADFAKHKELTGQDIATP